MCLYLKFFLGPVPTFFSNDPEATLEELKKKPEFGFQCLQALVSKLLARGELTRYTKLKICFCLSHAECVTVLREPQHSMTGSTSHVSFNGCLIALERRLSFTSTSKQDGIHIEG